MKKSLLWAVALSVTIGTGVRSEMKCAMEKGDGDSAQAKVINGRVKEMTKELGLDAEQQAKIKASMEKKWEEKNTLQDETSKKIAELEESTDQEIRAALTPEQLKKVDGMKKKSAVCCPLTEGKS
ncbi:MAG: hypothetical protein IPN90_03745 [Elusimicrobia bacterium]|nr:hypothetical protein [Elusimicrobiota bacterium]